MKTVFKKSVKNGIRAFIFPVILVAIIILLFVPLVYLTKGQDNNIYVIVITLSLMLLVLLPSIILQINYSLYDKNKIVNFDMEGLQFSIKFSDQLYLFRFSEISRIIKTSSIDIDYLTRRPPWIGHYYYTIQFNNGQKISLSNLLISKLEKLIIDVEIENEYKFFPLLYSNESSKLQ